MSLRKWALLMAAKTRYRVDARSGWLVKRVSKHCVSEEQYKKLNVIDVSPRTIPQARHKAMKAQLVSLKAQGFVEKFIIPGEVKGEPAYHIEIPQP